MSSRDGKTLLNDPPRIVVGEHESVKHHIMKKLLLSLLILAAWPRLYRAPRRANISASTPVTGLVYVNKFTGYPTPGPTRITIGAIAFTGVTLTLLTTRRTGLSQRLLPLLSRLLRHGLLLFLVSPLLPPAGGSFVGF